MIPYLAPMIVITGAAGFIGSNMITALNMAAYRDLVLVDDFSRAEREGNYAGKSYTGLVDRREFPAWMDKHHRDIQIVVHLLPLVIVTGDPAYPFGNVLIKLRILVHVLPHGLKGVPGI